MPKEVPFTTSHFDINGKNECELSYAYLKKAKEFTLDVVVMNTVPTIGSKQKQ